MIPREVVQKRVEEELQGTRREGINNLIEALRRTDYFTAPASTIYHDNYEGGLAVHCLKVLEVFKEKVIQFDLNLCEESVINIQAENIKTIVSTLRQLGLKVRNEPRPDSLIEVFIERQPPATNKIGRREYVSRSNSKVSIHMYVGWPQVGSTRIVTNMPIAEKQIMFRNENIKETITKDLPLTGTQEFIRDNIIKLTKQGFWKV
jgi:hypothetical protein